MFIPTVLLGMTFPLVARLFTQNLYRVGSGVGSSYAANTVGAVARRFCRRLYLDPQHRRAKHDHLRCRAESYASPALLVMGDYRSLRCVPRYALGAGAYWCWRSSCLSRCIALGSPCADQRRDDLQRPLRSVARAIPCASEEMKRDDVLFYREGLTTTVSVHRIPGSDYVYFKSNGKIDGSYGDALESVDDQLHRHAAASDSGNGADHRPWQRHVGQGAGHVQIAEATSKLSRIEPAMIEASKFFDRSLGAARQLPAAGVTLSPGRFATAPRTEYGMTLKRSGSIIRA